MITNIFVARNAPSLQRLCFSARVRLNHKPKNQKKITKDGAGDEFDIGVPIKGKTGLINRHENV